LGILSKGKIRSIWTFLSLQSIGWKWNWCKIKCLRLDNGGEFTSNDFNAFCKTHGIKRQFSALRTPHQNGVTERKNRIVWEASITMLNEAKILGIYWIEVVYTIVCILNREQLRFSHKKHHMSCGLVDRLLLTTSESLEENVT